MPYFNLSIFYTLEINTLYEKFQKFQKDIDSDTSQIREELEELVDRTDHKKGSIEFLTKYENELKNLISSELAGIVIILLQLKNEFDDGNLKQPFIISDDYYLYLKIKEIKNKLIKSQKKDEDYIEKEDEKSKQSEEKRK